MIYIQCHEYTSLLISHSEPSMAPMNVTATRLNDTAMNVSWTPLTLVEARGFVKYVITYMKAGGSRKRQSPSPKIVNGTDRSCVVNDLKPGVEYDVIVGAQTGGGTNGKHLRIITILHGMYV